MTVLTSRADGENGVPLRYIDDVTVASDGKIYFSDTTKLSPAVDELGVFLFLSDTVAVCCALCMLISTR